MICRTAGSSPDDAAVSANGALEPARDDRSGGDSIRAVLRAGGHGEYPVDLTASLQRLARPPIPAEVVASVRQRWEANFARILS